jgi:hypothetical protein
MREDMRAYMWRWNSRQRSLQNDSLINIIPKVSRDKISNDA